MAIPAQKRTENIKLSVNKYINEHADLAAITFNFQNSNFSPDSPELDQWVHVQPVTEMAEQNLHISCSLIYIQESQTIHIRKKLMT